MFENDANSSPSQNNNTNNSAAEYLRRAAQACAAGDGVLGMHLYLAAFERASQGTFAPNDAAIDGLRQAWKLALELKERSLAEYIFEKLEPYLSSEETALCVDQLQKLALDKLEEFGLSRENLEDMTQMISQDFFGMEGLSQLMKGDHSDSLSFMSKLPANLEFAEGKALTKKKTEEEKLKDTKERVEHLIYQDIVGYEEAIDIMRRFGIGVQKDTEFEELIRTLNARHGLDKMPVIDTFLFQSPVREDANQFMMATLGEIDLPAIRMHMEENLQGMPVLCVMAQADNQPRFNMSRNTFEGGGVLILEDIDLWGAPLSDTTHEHMDGLMYAQLSRGAREAINLIRSAVENPEVYVFASVAGDKELEGFFIDLLEPLTIVDIQQPSEAERTMLWKHLIEKHPSLHGIDLEKLVEFSARLSRYDIYMAAREAVEDAYKLSLATRNYQPVTVESLFEKIAAYQPLDSKEYQLLEDEIISGFRDSLNSIDDLLDNDEGQ